MQAIRICAPLAHRLFEYGSRPRSWFAQNPPCVAEYAERNVALPRQDMPDAHNKDQFIAFNRLARQVSIAFKSLDKTDIRGSFTHSCRDVLAVSDLQASGARPGTPR